MAARLTSVCAAASLPGWVCVASEPGGALAGAPQPASARTRESVSAAAVATAGACVCAPLSATAVPGVCDSASAAGGRFSDSGREILVWHVALQ